MEYCSALRRTGAWDTRHTGGPGTGSSADRPGRRDRTGSVPGGQSRGGGRQLVAAGGRARGAAAAECGASLRGDGASGGRWVLSGMRSPKRPLRGGGNAQVGGSAEGVPAGTRRPERATMKGDCGPTCNVFLLCKAGDPPRSWRCRKVILKTGKSRCLLQRSREGRVEGCLPLAPRTSLGPSPSHCPGQAHTAPARPPLQPGQDAQSPPPVGASRAFCGQGGDRPQT